MEPQTFPYMICEGIDDPWVSAVPSLWFDGKNCWWPPKCRDKQKIRKFIELGYLPDRATWTSYPAKMRKQYMTFEEAVQHENKAVDNPSGDIESTDNEKEKRSRGVRKTKLPFDPSSSPVAKKQKSINRRRIRAMTDSEDETPPRPPTPPTPPSSGLTSQKKAVRCSSKTPATSNKPGSSVVRSSNDLVDFEEDTFPSRSTPPSNTRALGSSSKFRALAGSSVVRSSNDLGDFEEDTFPSGSTPPSNTRALASTSKYHATSNRPGSSGVRSNDYMDFEEEDTFPSRSTPPSNTRALASTSKYRDDGIVNQFRQNEAGNRRPKVTSIPFESSDQFVQRGIVSISHDMRDNRSLGSAVLEQLKKIETRLMMEQDLEQDEFLLDFPLKSLDDFHSFDEEMLKNNSVRKKLHTHLTGIGGNDGRNIVRSIAKRLISKDLGKHFSWFGQKGNRNLSVTNIGKAIMRAAKREKPAISERDVVNVMIDFLRHCKDKPRGIVQHQQN